MFVSNDVLSLKELVGVHDVFECLSGFQPFQDCPDCGSISFNLGSVCVPAAYLRISSWCDSEEEP